MIEKSFELEEIKAEMFLNSSKPKIKVLKIFLLESGRTVPSLVV